MSFQGGLWAIEVWCVCLGVQYGVCVGVETPSCLKQKALQRYFERFE